MLSLAWYFRCYGVESLALASSVLRTTTTVRPVTSNLTLNDLSHQKCNHQFLPTSHRFFVNSASRSFRSSAVCAKPRRKVDAYQTVSIKCQTCDQRLFRYKKKNGTKSNLIKCYLERIVQDSANILQQAVKETQSTTTEQLNAVDNDVPPLEDVVFPDDYSWTCPNCQTHFARTAWIHGRPALKMIGGKIRMTKK